MEMFCFVLLLRSFSNFLIAMTTQVASAQAPTQEMRDPAHVAGWRRDTASFRWTGSTPATLLATLINEGKKEGGFANLRRSEIQDWDLE